MKKTLSCTFGLAILLLANRSFAQTLWWDGGTVNIGSNGDGISEGAAGTWDNSTQNWDQGNGLAHIAWSSVADANFSATGIAPGAGLVTLGAAITANSVTVSSTNYAFTDGGNSANTLTVNSVTNSAAVTISNNIVNSTGFTKAGSGALTLMAASSGLTGPLNVVGGTLSLGNNSTFAGPTGFGNVTLNNNAIFRINQTGTIGYGQTISGAGSFSLAANSSSSVITLSSEANTFTGSVTINQATLSVFSINDALPSDLGMGTNLIIGAGNSASILIYTGGGDTTTRTITLGGATPTTSIVANNIYGPLTLLGPLAFGSTNKHTLTLSGTSTYLNVFGGTIPDNTTTNTAVAKTAAGTWMLTGSNTYSGGTTISGGILWITNDNALGAAAGTVFLSGTSALKTTNNNVTLGASRTVTVSNSPSFGLSDTNNFFVASLITGPGAVTKASSSFSLGVVRFSNDANNYTGDFSIGYGNTEFTTVANQGAASSLGAGAAATGGQINLNNSSSSSTLRYVGTANSSTTRPLNWTATTGNLALDNTNTGTIAYLNTSTNLVNGAGNKTLTLQGSNTGTNTLAQAINDNSGTTTLNKSGTGKWVLTGANTYGGTTTISGGTLSVSSDGNLGTAPGSDTPGSLTINGGALSASAGFTLNAHRGIALGPTGTNSLSLGAPATGHGTIDVAAGQTLNYGGILANSTSTNTGGLIKTSTGTLNLSGANTYSGDTSISAGTLALSGSGSIADSTNISIASGATLDVSGVGGGYTLAPSQILRATNGATATINGSLNLGSAAMTVDYPDLGGPTINVTGGALTLAAGNATTVNISGGQLGAGNYKLISKGAGGSVAGTAPTSVTISPGGLVTGATGSLSISNSELYLVVSGGSVGPPVSFPNSGAVTNLPNGNFGVIGIGTVSSNWTLRASTDLSVRPFTAWTTVTTGTVTTSPFTVDTGVPSTAPKKFYIFSSP